MVAAALALAEYLAISLSFDARELVPAALEDVGQLAPIPILAGAAFLILRSSARDDTASGPTTTHAPARAPTQTTIALLLLHLVAFAAFVGASSAVRVRHLAEVDATALELVWLALAVATALSLIAAALAGRLLLMLRRLAAPLGLGGAVGVAAWAAGQGTGELWTPLSRAAMAPIAAIVRAWSADAVVDLEELVVGTERFSVRIDPVCSGYEGMGLVAVLLCSYLWAFRAALRFPHALLVPVLGVALAFVANVVRITALIYVGTLGAPDAAFNGFHSKAGWLLFCAVALGTVAMARRARVLRRSPDDDDDARTHNPSAVYLVPLLALVASTLFAGLAADGGLDHLEAVAVAAAAVALLAVRRELPAALSASGALIVRPWLAACAAGALVFVVWVAFEEIDLDAEQRVRAQLAAWSPLRAGAWISLRLVASVLVAPLVEELAFRGFLLRRIVGTDFTAVAYRHATPLALLVSAVVFGALHDRVIAGTIAGLVYGAVAWASGRLKDAVLAHAVTNALVAALVLGGGRWSLWG